MLSFRLEGVFKRFLRPLKVARVARATRQAHHAARQPESPHFHQHYSYQQHQSWKQQAHDPKSALWHLLYASSKHGSRRVASSPFGSFSSNGAFFQFLEKRWVEKLNQHKCFKSFHARLHRAHPRRRPQYFSWKYTRHILRHFKGAEVAGRRAGRRFFAFHKFLCPKSGRCRKYEGSYVPDVRFWMMERCKQREHARRSQRASFAPQSPHERRYCGPTAFAHLIRSRKTFGKAVRPLLTSQPQPCRPSRPATPASVHPHDRLLGATNPLSAAPAGRPARRLFSTVRPPESARRLYSNKASLSYRPSSSSRTASCRSSACRRRPLLFQTAIRAVQRWMQRVSLDIVAAALRTGLSIMPLTIRTSFLKLSSTSRRIALALVFGLPLLFLGAFLWANSERAPLSERWRLSLLSGDEKLQIKDSFFANTPHADNIPNEVKWYHILRKVLDEEHAPRGTLFEARVFAPGSDWRTDWITAELRALEATLGAASNPIQLGSMYIPPTHYPDSPVASAPAYTVLLVDRPEANAFSFGWSPSSHTPQTKQDISPGVIVVFSGLLDSILGQRSGGLEATIQNGGASMSQAQRNHLRVLLSHELSHLVLGHTLEFHIQQNHLWPRVRSLAVDTVRALVYPITSCLGPFFNDALFNSLSVLNSVPPPSASDSWALSCASQTMEIEADLVGLRLLAASSVDPHVALEFWQRRLDQQALLGEEAEEPLVHGHVPTLNSQKVHLHPHSGEKVSKRPSQRQDTGGQRTHPLDEKRIQSIRDQLTQWEEQGFLQAYSRVYNL